MKEIFEKLKIPKEQNSRKKSRKELSGSKKMRKKSKIKILRIC